MQNNYWIDRYHKENYSFFNTATSEKKCITSWTQYQNRKPFGSEIENWKKFKTQNYAIVCGEISNLVVFDVDTKNGGDPTPFLNRGMYEVRTPSGGYHFYTLYDPLLKSTKHKKSKHKGILKAVDVQSNGSIVFACPSFFSNGKYTVTNDVPITKLPDDLMVLVLDALEPEKVSIDYTPYIAPQRPEKGRPGDIFNALARWEDVLIPLGWAKVGGKENGIVYWRRPGKKDGISASTNWKGYNLFFPYTTSVDGLQQLKGYTKFHLLCVLKYDGNFNKGAKELVVENYKIANKIIYGKN
jgi:hypothetical protein